MLAERLGLNAIVGYLVAGLAVGPTALNLVRGGDDVAVLAEIGVALLLFTIGLEFSWRQLRRLGGRLLLGSALAVLGVTVVVAAIAAGLGQPARAAVALGMVASVGSTALVLRMLKERADFDAVYGKRSTGILLVQDALLVPLVVAMTFVGRPSHSAGTEIGMALLRTAGLVLGLVVFASFVVPRLLNERLIARNRELPILLAVGACVGSTWSAHELGVTPALGAFFAGALLADSRYSDLMRADMMPLRTVFTTLFFVSVGLVADIPWMLANFGWVFLAAAGVVAVKTVVTHLCLRPFVPGFVDTLAASLAVAQVGEFSFVLAKVGAEGEVLSQPLFQGVVAVSLLTLLATPVLVGSARPLARAIAMRLLPLRLLARREREAHSLAPWSGHVVLVGYGESGQAAARCLLAAGHHVVVVELNPTLHRRASECGFLAVLGDAASTEILLAARSDHAHAVVVTVPDSQVGGSVVAAAKQIDPRVPVVARARYHVHAESLRLAGADAVADEEETVGEVLALVVSRLVPEAAEDGEALPVGGRSSPAPPEGGAGEGPA